MDTIVQVEGLSFEEIINHYKDKSKRIREAVVANISSQYNVPIDIVRKSLLLDEETRVKSLSQAFAEYAEECEKPRLYFGMECLDSCIEGVKKGEAVIVAGRTSVGKTAFLGTLARRMAGNLKVLFLSLEMKASRIFERLACSELRIKRYDLENLVKLGLGENKVTPIISKYQNLLIYDKGSLNLKDLDVLLAEAEEFLDDKVDVAIIDYLGLLRVTSVNKSEYERMSMISKEVVAFAKRNDILVIAAAQCSRAAEGKPIEKNHLRGSGEIEEDADLIIGIWRDIQAEREKLKEQKNPNLIEVYLRILKNRNGISGKEFVVYLDAPHFEFLGDAPFKV